MIMKKQDLQLFPITDDMSWDEWLEAIEKALRAIGYTKYIQHYKTEDFMYWKTFNDEDGKKMYMVGIGFYDFRKYEQLDPQAYRIGTLFECMIIDTDDRIDMTVSKDMSLAEFESMARTFYKTMSPYYVKKVE